MTFLCTIAIVVALLAAWLLLWRRTPYDHEEHHGDEEKD